MVGGPGLEAERGLQPKAWDVAKIKATLARVRRLALANSFPVSLYAPNRGRF